MIVDKHTIVIGICGKNISPEQLDYLCTTYGEYIDSFYTSPPFGSYYNWKGSLVPFDFSYENCKILKDQIDVIKSHNIGIRMVLNNHHSFNDHAVKDVEHFNQMYGKPDYIVTMQEYVEDFYNNFDIPLALSCMNKFAEVPQEIVDKCKVVVFNSERNYDIDTMKSLRAQGKEIELIVNNGCSCICNKQCDDSCTACQDLAVEKYGLEKTIALQVLFPCELKLLSPYVDLWKISNRPSDFDRTEYALKMWTEGRTLEQLSNELHIVRDYHTPYNMAAFRNPVHESKTVDFNKVIEYKNEIWSEKLGMSIDIRDL